MGSGVIRGRFQVKVGFGVGVGGGLKAGFNMVLNSFWSQLLEGGAPGFLVL